jgi:predicted MPP superfamily phosphohydrolase
MYARLKTAFFRSFFRILVGFIALAEWVCVAWVLHACGVRVPWPVHVVAPLAIHQINRRVVARRRAAVPAGAFVRGYVAFAFGSTFCALFLAAAGLAALAGTLVVPLAPAAVAGPLERTYLWLVHAGFATTAGLLAWGYVVGPRELGVSRIDVPVRDLPPALDGFRIVHVSDLHIGQHLGLDELAEHVGRVNALEPDLVCITGDLVDRADTCAAGFPTLGGLRARHGVLVTLGNHDFNAGADHVTTTLRRTTSFTVLRDATAEIRVGDARLAVVGVDDLGLDWARGVTEHPALARLVAAAGRPLVVLTHRPDCFPQAAGLGAALVLAGHTHGGQLALPPWLGGRARGGRGRNLAELISRFDRGLYRDGDATLYVNRGLGFTAQRIRLFTPREIAVLELRRA